VQNRTWQGRGWAPRKIFVWLASLASPPTRSFENSKTVNSLGYTWSFQFYVTTLGHVCISRQEQITWEFAIALQDSDRKQTNSAKASSTSKKATPSANRKTVRYVFLCWFLQSNLHGHLPATGTNLYIHTYIHTYIHDLFDKAGYRSIGKTLSPDVDLHYLI